MQQKPAQSGAIAPASLRHIVYRPEAVAQKKPTRITPPIRITSPYLSTAANVGLFVSAVILLFCCFGKVTQVVSAPGILIPAENSVKIYALQTGILKKVFVTEGQFVNEGDPLFESSSEQFDSQGNALYMTSINAYRLNVTSLNQQKELQRSFNEELEKLVLTQIQDLQGQLESNQAALNVADKAIQLDSKIALRKGDLNSEGAITVVQVERSMTNLAEEQKSYFQISATRAGLLSQMHALEAKQSTLHMTLQLESMRIDQQISSLQVQIDSLEKSHETTLLAPVSGILAFVKYKVGETLRPDQAVMVINPGNKSLVAQVLVSSSGVGFLKLGGRMSIKYDAFPYQIFGYYNAHIVSISKVALPVSDAQILKIPISSDLPVFNVLASIDRQDVDTYGTRTPLLAGSTFTANLNGETRYVWQWMLNPLLAIKGSALSMGLE